LCALAAERDRTRLGILLIGVLSDALALSHATLSRHAVRKDGNFLIPLVDGVNPPQIINDAYLLTLKNAVALADAPLLQRCVAEGRALVDDTEDRSVCVLPLYQQEQIHLLIKIERKHTFSQDELGLAQQLANFFNGHLQLIDYAETDTLTGLYNRKTFDEHLDRVLAHTSAGEDGELSAQLPRRRHAAEHASNWLAIIDIDHFKQINDRHGHLIGDEVLVLLARLMRNAFRLDDQLFRFGGEEFITVLQAGGGQNALNVLERFRRQVEAYAFPMVGDITISIGFTEVTQYDNPTDLIDRADKALYFAKEHGRNRVENFDTLQAAHELSVGRARQASDIELF
jgi:diguanylate cyclase (GGDEF)-like protein